MVSIISIIMSVGCSNTNDGDFESAVISIAVNEVQITINDSSSLNVIKEYIEAGVKEEGISDYIVPAPYEILISYSNNTKEVVNLYLFDQDDNSSYVFVKDENIGYTVNQANTQALKELLNDLIENSDVIDK